MGMSVEGDYTHSWASSATGVAINWDRREKPCATTFKASGGSPPRPKRLAVLNPATGEELGRTPAVPRCGGRRGRRRPPRRAFPGWRRVPVTERVQYLFKLKQLLEEQFEDVARTITMECGKTLVESRGEMRRAIENVEVACGAPTLIQGYNSEDIASGIDEIDDPPAARRVRDHRAVQFPRR